MALETGTYISDLVATNPTGSDPLAFADDHLRLVKGSLKSTFPNITGAVTKTHAEINALASLSQVFALIYPVGSIYTNAANSSNPSTLFGFGTWVQFGAGRVTVGFDGGDSLFNAAEKTGGSKDAALVSHTHTASASSAGEHNHSIYGGSNSLFPPGAVSAYFNHDNIPSAYQTTSSAGIHAHDITVNAAGSSATNANLQPYITVYMWKRTA